MIDATFLRGQYGTKFEQNLTIRCVIMYVDIRNGDQMQTSEECLLMYRHRLRQLLHQEGIPSNPGVDDAWILDRLEELVSGLKSGSHHNKVEIPDDDDRDGSYAEPISDQPSLDNALREFPR
jgi:hypothetical protein